MLAAGMPDTIADRMLDLERYFREDRAITLTDDVKRVTGKSIEVICRLRAGHRRDGCVECRGRVSDELKSLRWSADRPE